MLIVISNSGFSLKVFMAISQLYMGDGNTVQRLQEHLVKSVDECIESIDRVTALLELEEREIVGVELESISRLILETVDDVVDDRRIAVEIHHSGGVLEILFSLCEQFLVCRRFASCDGFSKGVIK